jgi:DNA-binding MarR family transcriptional regulator
MFIQEIKRLFDAYPAIYLACHRRHVRDDESGAVVTAHQASILDHLDVQKATTASKLAEHLGIGRSAMSIQVNRLVRKGYVRRTAMDGDGRKVGLLLTPAGSRIQRYNTVLDPELVRAMFAGMTKAELERALEGIELLAKYATILTRRKQRR